MASSDVDIQIDNEAVEFFKRYSKIISKDSFDSNRTYEEWKNLIQQKVIEIGRNALAIYAYRCISQGRFAVSRMNLNFGYQKYLKNSQLSHLKIIDIGCCFGTDIRQLLLDGASISNITALDQYGDFWKLGLDLFDDQRYDSDLFKANIFIEASLLSDDFYSKLGSFLGHDPKGYYDVVYMGSVLHLLSYQEIERFIEAACSLLKSGGVYFGQNVGVTHDGYISMLNNPESNSTNQKQPTLLKNLHSPKSLRDVLIKKGFGDDTMEVDWSDSEWDNKMSRQNGTDRGFMNFYSKKL